MSHASRKQKVLAILAVLASAVLLTLSMWTASTGTSLRDNAGSAISLRAGSIAFRLHPKIVSLPTLWQRDEVVVPRCDLAFVRVLTISSVRNPSSFTWLVVYTFLPGLVLLGIAGLLCGRAFGIEKRRTKCLRCNYALVNDRCPECGPSARNQPRFRWVWIACCFAPAFIFVGSVLFSFEMRSTLPIRLNYTRGEIVLLWRTDPARPLEPSSGFLSLHKQRGPDATGPISQRPVVLRWRPIHMATSPWPNPSAFHQIALPLWHCMVAGLFCGSWLMGRGLPIKREKNERDEVASTKKTNAG